MQATRVLRFVAELALAVSPIVALAQSGPVAEYVTIPIRPDGLSMTAELFRPAGVAPHPVMVYSHGRSGTPEDRANIPEAVPREYLAFWLERGFAVVAPARPGYGRTGGPDREVPGHRWEPSGQCAGRPDFDRMINVAARAPLAVLEWLNEQAWADTKRVILSGNSVGGMATLAAAATRPPGVIGIINFAGGVGGNPTRSPGRSCEPRQIERVSERTGKAVQVPNLWLYAENDLFWGPSAPKAWHTAFAAGGSPTTMIVTAPLEGKDGHDLIFFGRNLWQQPVESFLRSLNLQ